MIASEEIRWQRAPSSCQLVWMLLILTGSSCSGKSTLAFPAGERFDRLAVHEMDESGVPQNPPRYWRNHITEEWIQRALEYQADGIDLLLTAQTPLGEILASPSAPLLDGIAMCLVDVADAERRRRLDDRDPGRWSEAAIDAYINWAAWHRGHAQDPEHRPEVIIDKGAPNMAWHRWTSWTANDPRWQTHILDTTDRDRQECVAELEQWVTRIRADFRAGRHLLSNDWMG
ncbi:hypothetical protein [Streptomyces sp. S.PB5]|uniref:hypothetical protein n=1 Tax=Streptomyces sp. S.PB5 TaxID=3020844 RepID=UPI0025B19B31|nr:hypothetical protein [Streptomyces sp. S.PB5]MDN3025690.1 hypothetical protein [Streptomyces sp. S.PB5]